MINVSKHMFTVYILRSLKDSNLYVGMTSNIVSRLKKHQAGGVPSTKHRRPWKLFIQKNVRIVKPHAREKYFLRADPVIKK